METHYALFDLLADATQTDIQAAYQRQRTRYSTQRVAALDDEFRRIAEARTTEFARAYTVLSDPQKRRAYDASIGLAPPVTERQATRRAGVSRRELLLAIGGGVAGLLVIAVVWALAGRGAQAGLPAVGEVSRPAPEFALPGLNGEIVRLSDYKGKVVLVNFWGTWCVPCKEETPALQATYQKLHDQGLMIIGVDLRNQERPGAEGDTNVRNFVQSYAVTYPIALDVTGDTARAFRIYPIPTSFFVDQTGTIRYVAVSKVSGSDVEAIFAKLKQEAALAH